jgi:hydroxyacylglutathione hydrolase
MTGIELRTAIDCGKPPVIVDVRSQAEFEHGHVPGAIHLPFWAVPTRASSLAAYRDSPLVLYCEHGPRAWMAGAALRTLGFKKIDYLEGHMHEWRQAGLPEVRG